MDSHLVPRVIPPTYRHVDTRLNDAVLLKMEQPHLSFSHISSIVFDTDRRACAIRYHYNKTVYESRRARPLRLSETILPTITEDPKDGGYQLCARCGKVMSAGDVAEFRLRANFYRIYSHPEGWTGPNGETCERKAVKGWKALKALDAIRKRKDADPEEIIQAELDAVELHQQWHMPPSDDARQQLEDFIPLVWAMGAKGGQSPEADPEDCPDDQGQSVRGHTPVFRNYVEDALIVNYNWAGRLASECREVLWKERNKSYASSKAYPGDDKYTNFAPYNPGPERKRKARRKKDKRRS